MIDSHCRYRFAIAIVIGAASIAQAVPPRHRLQPRHPADPVGELLLLPRAGREQAQADLRLDVRDVGDRSGRDRPERCGRQANSSSGSIRTIRTNSDAAAEIESAADCPSKRDCWSDGSRKGADYAPHWAFVAPERPPEPAVQRPMGAERRSTDSCSRSSKPKGCRPRPKPTAPPSSGDSRST